MLRLEMMDRLGISGSAAVSVVDDSCCGLLLWLFDAARAPGGAQRCRVVAWSIRRMKDDLNPKLAEPSEYIFTDSVISNMLGKGKDTLANSKEGLGQEKGPAELKPLGPAVVRRTRQQHTRRRGFPQGDAKK
eukprot:scaffold6849_cov154-Skeletonema_dohrnii-CCMP3373.AAC.1